MAPTLGPASCVKKIVVDYREPGPPPESLGTADELSSAPDDADSTDAEHELREWRVDVADHGQRLDRVLALRIDAFSRSHLQSLIERGHVRVDGVVANTASRRLRAAQHLAVELVPTASSRAFRAEAMALQVVYEDEHLLVIDKPAGLVVHPAAGNWSGTLLNGLLARDAAAFDLPRAGIVHRLDKDTSGLMLVARSLLAMTALTRAIAAREVHREYLALAHGVVVPAAFSVEAPMGRDPASRVGMAVVAGGKAARTDVLVLASRGGSEAVSALRCILHSGRTHQIRVHLASRGHPLLADTLYGGRPLLGLQRQALHAAHLRLAHPATGEPMVFESVLPPELLRAWDEVVGD